MEDYNDIRAYNDNDVPEALQALVKEPAFLNIVEAQFPNVEFSELSKKAATVEDIQRNFVCRYVDGMLLASSDGLTFTGLDNLEKDKAHFFISNHRDIILDSTLLNYILLENGHESTEIAIGDNLLIYPWIKTLVRLNKSFIVKRGLPIKQMMVESQRLSNYIQHTIHDKVSSIWIAQREGRAKDSDDRTSNALLKMLSMTGRTDFINCLSEMDITPLSIAYEFDPCDYLKAREFLLKSKDPDFKKSPGDDLLNMKTGIEGYKGRIHFHFAKPLTKKLLELMAIEKKNERVKAVAEMIDVDIHMNYKFFPCNFVAHDILHQSEEFSSYYTEKDKQAFEAYINKQLDRIPERATDEEYLRNSLLTMYANTLINHLVAHTK